MLEIALENSHVLEKKYFPFKWRGFNFVNQNKKVFQ